MVRSRAESPPWQPTAEWRQRSYYGNRRSEMLPFLPRSPRLLLDVGCGRGAFGSNVKQTLGCRVWGIELNRDAARLATARLDRVINADMHVAFAQLPAGHFDCIVFNDILEHLTDPYTAIVNAKRLLGPGGVVVASLPNVRHAPVVWDLLWRGRWDYADAGVLDRTHLRFFTKVTVRALFENHGYRVHRLEGINSMVESRLARLAVRVAPPRFRDMQFMQFAVVAEPRG